MTRFLSNFFRSVITLSPEYLLACVYLCCNRIAPAYSGKELGIGDGTLLKALSEATGSTPAKLKSLLVKLGDLGETAQQSRSNQRTLIQPPPLTVPGVFNEFKRMSEVAGKDANNKKKTTIKSLLVACRGEEAKFMARALQGNLRIGLQAKTVMAALARAVVLTPPRQEGFPPPILNSSKGQSAEKVAAEIERVHKILAQAFIEAPSYDLLVDAILNMPIDEIPQRIHLTPGVPIQVMLAQILCRHRSIPPIQYMN
jgi:DNA ligase-1